MIGGGEALGQVMASYFYSKYNFTAECDMFNILVFGSLIAVLYLEFKIARKEANSYEN